MTTTTHEAETPAPVGRGAPWPREEAMAIAHEAYRRLADLVATIGDDDWARPTDCEAWTVRDLVGHLHGALRAAASMRVNLGQLAGATRRARAQGGDLDTHLSAIQVEQAAGLTTEQLVAEIAALVDPATRGRRRTPAPMRRLVSVRVTMGAIDERWRLAYLVDLVLTRDAWLHRIDLCRALGREPELTADHDGRIVADVAEEWGRRHGKPFRLTLSGPAGGSFGAGAADDAEPIELDAVEFCRIVSGRAPATGLLTTGVPF
jgi:uncharacterized protein (TIGR03083 family)